MFNKGFAKVANLPAVIGNAARSGFGDKIRAGLSWAKNNPGKAVGAAYGANTAANLVQGKGLRQSLTSSAISPAYKEKDEA
jgi:hypothetical protein